MCPVSNRARPTRHTPFEVSCDTTGLQALIQPRASDGHTVGTPSLLDSLQPLIDLTLKSVKTKVEMLSLAALGSSPVEFAARVDQPASRFALLFARGVPIRLKGVKKVTTGITLSVKWS